MTFWSIECGATPSVALLMSKRAATITFPSQHTLRQLHFLRALRAQRSRSLSFGKSSISMNRSLVNIDM